MDSGLTEDQLLMEMQRYITNVGITASALRNLGAKDLVKTARKFLSETVDLKPLRAINPSEYSVWLNDNTEALTRAFPKTRRKLWGPARKAINIFMVMAYVNRFICEAYKLDRLGDVLELPLDNPNALELLKLVKEKRKAHWVNIKELRPEESRYLQELAGQKARELGIPRGRLDTVLFRQGNRHQ